MVIHMKIANILSAIYQEKEIKRRLPVAVSINIGCMQLQGKINIVLRGKKTVLIIQDVRLTRKNKKLTQDL